MDILLQIGAVAFAITAVIVLIGMVWKMIKLLTRIVNEVVGAPGQPSLGERIDHLAERQDEHMEIWHSPKAAQRTNGGRPR